MNNFFAAFVILLFGWIIFSTVTSSESKDQPDTKDEKSQSEEYIFERFLEREGADSATLELEMTAGELLLSSGTTGLLDSYVTYRRSEFEPELNISDEHSGHPHISLKHKRDAISSTFHWGSNNSSRNKWDLKLNPDIRYDLDINAGLGKSKLDLADTRIGTFRLRTGVSSADVDLRNTSVSDLDLKTGVGSVTLDLSGERQNDLVADISGGVGSVIIKVPSEYGVRFRASGLGSITADGFYREGRFHKNDLYGETDYNIDIDIAGGIGSVEVVML